MITGDSLPPSVKSFFAKVSVKVGDKEGDLSEPSTTISKVCSCDNHVTSAIAHVIIKSLSCDSTTCIIYSIM